MSEDFSSVLECIENCLKDGIQELKHESALKEILDIAQLARPGTVHKESERNWLAIESIAKEALNAHQD